MGDSGFDQSSTDPFCNQDDYDESWSSFDPTLFQFHPPNDPNQYFDVNVQAQEEPNSMISTITPWMGEMDQPTQCQPIQPPTSCPVEYVPQYRTWTDKHLNLPHLTSLDQNSATPYTPPQNVSLQGQEVMYQLPSVASVASEISKSQLQWTAPLAHSTLPHQQMHGIYCSDTAPLRNDIYPSPALTYDHYKGSLNAVHNRVPDIVPSNGTNFGDLNATVPPYGRSDLHSKETQSYQCLKPQSDSDNPEIPQLKHPTFLSDGPRYAGNVGEDGSWPAGTIFTRPVQDIMSPNDSTAIEAGYGHVSALTPSSVLFDESSPQFHASRSQRNTSNRTISTEPGRGTKRGRQSRPRCIDCKKLAVHYDHSPRCDRCGDKYLRKIAVPPQFDIDPAVPDIAAARHLIYPAVAPTGPREDDVNREALRADDYVRSMIDAICTPYTGPDRWFMKLQTDLNGVVAVDRGNYYTNSMVTARLRALFQAAVDYHTGAEATVYPYGAGWTIQQSLTFSERMKMIVDSLRTNKIIALDVLQGKGVLGFAGNPTAYESRKLTNRGTNSNKAVTHNLGLRAKMRSQMTRTPSKTVDDHQDSILDTEQDQDEEESVLPVYPSTIEESESDAIAPKRRRVLKPQRKDSHISPKGSTKGKGEGINIANPLDISAPENPNSTHQLM